MGVKKSNKGRNSLPFEQTFVVSHFGHGFVYRGPFTGPRGCPAKESSGTIFLCYSIYGGIHPLQSRGLSDDRDITLLQVTLSERNTVELIIKLKELGFLGTDLLHTSNGREYVTRDKLVTELREVLREHGGRLSLVEVPSLLGMDLVHCQAAADALCDISGTNCEERVIVTNGELFSSLYFADLAKEIEDSLQSSGILALADIARTQGLTMDMLTGEVSKNVGTTIHGVFDQVSNSLYTNIYIDRVKCQVRGALRGCLHPLNLSVLKKDICGVEGPAGFFPGLVDEVVREEHLEGKIASGMDVWIPSAHLHLQMKAVNSFFTQNHYVSVDYARKNGIENEGEYFKKMEANGVLLDTVYISPQIIHSLVAIVDDAVMSPGGNGFCDLQEHAPAEFSEEDVAKLLDYLLRDDYFRHNKKNAALKVFCDTCIVSSSFLDSISQSLQSEVAVIARDDFAASQQQNISSSGELDSSTIKSKVIQPSDEGDDDWGLQKGKGKKKSRGGNNKNKGPKPEKKTSPANTELKKSGTSRIKSPEYICALVIKMHPQLEHHEDLALAISSSLVPVVSSAYDKATSELFTAGASRRKEIKEKASSLLQDNYYWLELFGKGTDIVFASEKLDASRASASWHVIKSNGIMCLDPLLHFLNADIASANKDSSDPSDVVKTILEPAQRSSIIQECPGNLSTNLNWLLTATKSNVAKDMAEFINMIRDTAEESGIRLRSLDKKTEASLSESHMNVLKEQLSLAESSPMLLAAAVPILLLKHMNACTNLAGKSLSPAIDALKSHMDEEDIAVLVEFHENVLEQLRKGSDGDSDVSPSSLYCKVKDLCKF